MEASEAARIQCPHCHKLAEPQQKRELNNRGVWLREGQHIDRDGNITGEARRSRIASFWMEGPAAAYQTWAQLVYKLLTAEEEYERTGSEEALKAVINTDWGLPYQSRRSLEARSGDALMARAEDVSKRTVPDGVRFIVATVDVQGGKKRRFVVQMVGYGAYGERWIIDRYNIRYSLRVNENGESQPVNPAAMPEDWDLLRTDVLDNASKLQQFSKEWQDANDKWNAMWGVKIEQTKDGKYYVAGLGLSMEDTPDGKISQFLVAADRIAYINPANGNQTPGFVMQGDQIIMNEAFLKYLSAPTITSGGNPPAFSLTPDGKLTAKNADISGHINAVSGSFTGEINATSGKFSGVIEAKEFVGDICGSKVMQGVSIRATNDERSTSTRYTDSATYQIGKTITVMANCERNGGSGAITVTININGQVKTAEVMPYTAGIPAMYQTVVFSVYTTSPVVDISVSLRVGGQYTTEASVWPLVMVSRSGNNFTN
ncbi:DUF1983 domain-containing protein [Salmonella enterica]|nr:DUF1983 domain-containing protein [Salmonella enterica]EAO6291629.1 DUF1983 domain-containing protein [Salmonella enterica]